MQPPNQRHEPEYGDGRQERSLARVFFWIGVGLGLATLGATLAYVSLRLSSTEGEDPTTARIQDLIDEANSLLKALDDQRHSA